MLLLDTPDDHGAVGPADVIPVPVEEFLYEGKPDEAAVEKPDDTPVPLGKLKEEEELLRGGGGASNNRALIT